jgi:hypothetical protein
MIALRKDNELMYLACFFEFFRELFDLTYLYSPIGYVLE